MNKPYAESAEQNKSCIFDAIKPYLRGQVLEIGSGTGQHAVYFCAQLARIDWQPSELAPNLPGIQRWIEESGLDNIRPPIVLDVLGDWPTCRYDLVYSANTFHIMGETAVAASIAGAGRCLRPGGVFAVYGPFSYGGRHTADSNAAFDAMLRGRDPDSGIRDFDWLDQLAREADMNLLDDVEMPVNNRTLIWQKRT